MLSLIIMVARIRTATSFAMPFHQRFPRLTCLLAEPPIDDGFNVKFRTRLDEPKVGREEASSRAQMNTINSQLLAEIEAAKSSIRNARCLIYGFFWLNCESRQVLRSRRLR